MSRSYSVSSAWLGLCREVFGYTPEHRELSCGASLDWVYSPSLLFGGRLVSMPFSDESGLSLPDGFAASPEACRELAALAGEQLARRKVACFELRGHNPLLAAAASAGLCSASEPYIKFVLDISRPYETIPAGYHVNLHKNLRKARKHLNVFRRTEADIARVLYPIYLWQMRKFGSPPLPEKYFTYLLKSGLASVWTAELSGKTAAFLFAFEHDGTLFADLNGSLPEYDEYFPKIMLFDASIRDAASRGFKDYDFMRTRKGGGVSEHKAKWGGREIPITYYTFATNGAKAATLEPGEARFALGRAAFRVMPPSLAARLGPRVRKEAAK